MRGRETIHSQYGSVNSDKEPLSQHKTRIEKLYLNEFEDGISSIFQDSESIFLYRIINRVKLAVGEYTRKVICDEKDIKEIIKSQDDILMDRYYQLKKIFLRLLNDFKKFPNMKMTEFLFRRHCKNCPDYALHTCQNRLLIVKENNEPKYLICTECKTVFFANSLVLFCKPCNTEYYSSVVNSINDTEIHPATWVNYHCGTLLNEQMRCLKCSHLLFLRNSDNLLFCAKCNFISDPKKIVWICTFCKNEFQSNAKIYNSLEFTNIKLAIKDTLLNRKVAIPSSVPCCGESAYSSGFRHRKNCTGELFSGDLKGKRILVCNKCKSITNIDGFIWTCPICDVKFKSDLKKKESRNDNISKLSQEKSKDLSYPVITPVKMKNSDTNFNSQNNNDKDYLSPINKKSVISAVKVVCGTAESDNKNPKKREEEVRNHSVFKYKNEDTKINKDCSGRMTGNLITIREEDNDKDKLHNHNIQENEDNIPELKLGKVGVVSKFDSGKLEKNQNTSSKNSNSSNMNNNETSDSLNRTSSNKLNLQHLVPIPGKDKSRSRMMNLVAVNCDDYATTMEKELSSEFFKKNVIQKGKNIFSTPETQKNKEKEKGSFSSINKEDNSKISTPVIISKNNFRSNKSPELNISSNTPNKNSINTSSEEENDENLPVKPLESFNIEDFKIVTNIGEGSFGVIYSTENLVSKEKFAMKKILVNNEDDLKLFQNEFELVNRFPHRNILKIFGLCSKTLDFSTKVLYIQMELAISDWDKEIKKRFKTNNFYKENDIINILKQVVLALCFLQKKGISHRDVKPQNILIFSDNVFKVADFGEAKEVKMTNKQLDTLRGTELYMSPILFTTLRNTNKNNVKHNIYKSDVFSLGYCILYAATLSFKILYDLRHVNNQKYANNIIKTYLGKKYSQTFIDCLCKMVDVNENNRYDFLELNKYLKENLV